MLLCSVMTAGPAASGWQSNHGIAGSRDGRSGRHSGRRTSRREAQSRETASVAAPEKHSRLTMTVRVWWRQVGTVAYRLERLLDAHCFRKANITRCVIGRQSLSYGPSSRNVVLAIDLVGGVPPHLIIAPFRRTFALPDFPRPSQDPGFSFRGRLALFDCCTSCIDMNADDVVSVPADSRI